MSWRTWIRLSLMPSEKLSQWFKNSVFQVLQSSHNIFKIIVVGSDLLCVVVLEHLCTPEICQYSFAKSVQVQELCGHFFVYPALWEQILVYLDKKNFSLILSHEQWLKYFIWAQNQAYHDILLFVGSHCPVAALRSVQQNRGTRRRGGVRTNRWDRTLTFKITGITEKFTLSSSHLRSDSWSQSK